MRDPKVDMINLSFASKSNNNPDAIARMEWQYVCLWERFRIKKTKMQEPEGGVINLSVCGNASK